MADAAVRHRDPRGNSHCHPRHPRSQSPLRRRLRLPPAPADAKPKSVDEALIKALDAQAPCGSHVDPMWIPCGSHVDPSAVCGIRCFGVRKFEL